jgi:hypothetical protein
MIYFFEGQFRQVEIDLERPSMLADINATGASQTERFGSATDDRSAGDGVSSGDTTR